MVKLKSQLGGNIWKYYAYQLLTSFFFILPVIVLFWQENGLSFLEVMILQSLFSGMVVLLEVPTGYFADIYGRRNSLLIGSFFWLIAWIVYSLSGSFAEFLVAEALLAFGVGLVSGADTALLYDSLIDLKREKEFKKIRGSVFMWTSIILGISSIVGGYIAEIFSYRFNYYLMIAFWIVVIPFVWSMKEPERHKLVIEKGYTKKLLEIGHLVFVKNVKLRWLLVYGAVIAAFNHMSFWMYQPYFELSGLNVAYIGVVFAGFQVASALAGKFAHDIEERLGERYSLFLLLVFLAAGMMLMGNFVFMFSFSFAFLQQFAYGFYNVVMEDYVNKLSESSMRATVLSFKSMVERCFMTALMPIAGWSVDLLSLPQVYMLYGGILGVLGSVVLFLLWRVKGI